MESIQAYQSLICDREERLIDPLFMDYYLPGEPFDMEVHLTIQEFEQGVPW